MDPLNFQFSGVDRFSAPFISLLLLCCQILRKYIFKCPYTRSPHLRAGVNGGVEAVRVRLHSSLVHHVVQDSHRSTPQHRVSVRQRADQVGVRHHIRVETVLSDVQEACQEGGVEGLAKEGSVCVY